MNKCLIVFVLMLCWTCKSPEARRPESVSSGSFIKESVERNKELFAKEKSIFEGLMKEHPDRDYIASQNGFWYYYNKKAEDTLSTPEFGDIVNFDYNIQHLNGSTIYSKSDLKTQNYAMDQQEIFTGLREGLKLMKSGETETFLFPSQKAYGYYGDSNRIGINVPLICEVTVNSITKNHYN